MCRYIEGCQPQRPGLSDIFVREINLIFFCRRIPKAQHAFGGVDEEPFGLRAGIGPFALQEIARESHRIGDVMAEIPNASAGSGGKHFAVAARSRFHGVIKQHLIHCKAKPIQGFQRVRGGLQHEAASSGCDGSGRVSKAGSGRKLAQPVAAISNGNIDKCTLIPKSQREWRHHVCHRFVTQARPCKKWLTAGKRIGWLSFNHILLPKPFAIDPESVHGGQGQPEEPVHMLDDGKDQ